MLTKDEKQILFRFAVSIGTKFWDRRQELETGEVGFPLVTDSIFRMPQMIISLATLQDFQHALQVWLDAPTDDFEFELAGPAQNQRLHFLLQDLRGKRVLPDYQVDLTCSGWNTAANVRIGVDVTCINLLVESLTEFISVVLNSHKPKQK